MSRSVGRRCWFCGNKLTRRNNSIDHLRPKSRGGSLAKWNTVPSCRTCNKDKAHLTVDEYRLVVMFRKGYLANVKMPKFKFYGELMKETHDGVPARDS